MDDPRRPAREPGPVALPSRRILICEDEENLRTLVRAVLGPGYEYDETADGAEALELARAHPPDLIALDLMIPPTSGFEVLARLRSDPVTRETPVVVVTAWTHLEDAARAAGADRFLTKPFDPDVLRDVVRELLDAA